MNDRRELSRSPLLMSRHDTGVLVVDMQSKLLHLIPGHTQMTFNIGRLLDAAKLFEMAIAGTEQYPQGLGGTEPELARRLPNMPDKMQFSCRECQAVWQYFRQQNCRRVLVSGIETHVCIQQTVLDALAEGWEIYVAVDAVGSRHVIDYEIALRRMEMAGATLTTTEAALFEWCESADDPHFKAISMLIRQQPPG